MLTPSSRSTDTAAAPRSQASAVRRNVKPNRRFRRTSFDPDKISVANLSSGLAAPRGPGGLGRLRASAPDGRRAERGRLGLLRQGAQSIADGWVLVFLWRSDCRLAAPVQLVLVGLDQTLRLRSRRAHSCQRRIGMLQGALWTCLYSHLHAGERDRAATGLVAIYIALTIALYERSILAHNLFYTILPAFILAVWKGINPCEPRRRFFIALSCFLGITLVESHISGLAYVAAAAFLAAVSPEGRLNVRRRTALTSLAAPLTASLVTAAWLGQIGGHPIEGVVFRSPKR